MLGGEDEEKLQDIFLIVSGELYADEALAEKFSVGRIKYKKLRTVKKDAIMIAGRGTFALTEDMLHDNPKGIAVIGCGMVTLDTEIPSQELKEKVSIMGCGCVMCSKEQKGTVEILAEGCGYIDAHEEEKEEKEDEAQTESEQSQSVINVVINSDVYKM